MRSALRWMFVPAVLVSLPALVAAQRMGPGHFGGAAGFRAAHFHHQGFRGAYYPFGYFDPLYSDDLSGRAYPSSEPRGIVLQSPQPAPPTEPAPAPAQPLMIELQGDHYVQISGGQPSQNQTIDASAKGSAMARSSAIKATENSNTSTVLIFRDGHRQPVTAYTIVGGTLYASSDYATTGSWNQAIALSALNVPDTIAANRGSGHTFQIPSFPNEVFVGP